MIFIYILELENNKFYIGKTNNLNIRLDQHYNLNGSEWTKKHKSLRLFELIPNCDDLDEDKYTLKYMKKYGIENVRGGSFCQVNLNDDTMNTIKKMITGYNNACYICNENGHYAINCNKNNRNDKNELTNIKCYKCNKNGHYANNCIETIFNCKYCDKEFNKIRNKMYHENVICKNKNNKIISNEISNISQDTYNTYDTYDTSTNNISQNELSNNISQNVEIINNDSMSDDDDKDIINSIDDPEDDIENITYNNDTNKKLFNIRNTMCIIS